MNGKTLRVLQLEETGFVESAKIRSKSGIGQETNSILLGLIGNSLVLLHMKIS